MLIILLVKNLSSELNLTKNSTFSQIFLIFLKFFSDFTSLLLSRHKGKMRNIQVFWAN